MNTEEILAAVKRANDAIDNLEQVVDLCIEFDPDSVGVDVDGSRFKELDHKGFSCIPDDVVGAVDEVLRALWEIVRLQHPGVDSLAPGDPTNGRAEVGGASGEEGLPDPNSLVTIAKYLAKETSESDTWSPLSILICAISNKRNLDWDRRIFGFRAVANPQPKHVRLIFELHTDPNVSNAVSKALCEVITVPQGKTDTVGIFRSFLESTGDVLDGK
jgi:hypothetical protein